MGFDDFNPFAFQQSHVDALLMQLCIEQGEEQKVSLKKKPNLCWAFLL